MSRWSLRKWPMNVWRDDPLGDAVKHSMPFDYDKAEQIAAAFLSLYPTKGTTRLELIKLMYLANRRCIEETGVPMLSDASAAMKHGPILSHTLNLLREQWKRVPNWISKRWRQHFANVGKKGVRLKSDPGRGLLSRYELRIIEETYDQWGGRQNELYDFVHELPEYKRNKPDGIIRKVIPISIAELFEAVGRSVDESSIHERFDSILKARQMFSS